MIAGDWYYVAVHEINALRIFRFSTIEARDFFLRNRRAEKKQVETLTDNHELVKRAYETAEYHNKIWKRGIELKNLE